MEELELLEELNAAHNKLIYIPSELGRLCNLRELDLNNNMVLGLPRALFEDQAIFSLRKLDISYNQISDIPFSIGNVKGLRSLKVSGNKLKYIPSECKELRTLDTFHYGDNDWYEESCYDANSKAYGVKALIKIITLSL